MKRKLPQWILCSIVVFLATCLLLEFFEETTFDIVATLLTPWFSMCKALTPLSWQVRGNIFLALMWIFSGVAVYSMLIGACLVTSRHYLARHQREQPAFSPREKKK